MDPESNLLFCPKVSAVDAGVGWFNQILQKCISPFAGLVDHRRDFISYDKSFDHPAVIQHGEFLLQLWVRIRLKVHARTPLL